MVIEQSKAPVLDTVAPQSETVAPVPTVAKTVAPGVNPSPLTDTATPLGPWVGERTIDGAVIMKVAAALSKLPSDPVALRVYGVEDAAPVTVTEQANEPVPPTTAPQVETVPPALMASATVRPGVKPEPETATVAPLGPWVGERASAGVVIVNVAVEESKPPSDPVATSAYAVADATPFTSTTQLKEPAPLVAAPQTVSAAPAPIVVVTMTPGVNPAPVTVVVAPLGPCVGESEIVG